MGIVLFNMVTGGDMPFAEATEKDPLYKYFAKGRASQYFKKQQPNISDELKDLLTSILQIDPTQRPTIAEILEDDWMM